MSIKTELEVRLLDSRFPPSLVIAIAVVRHVGSRIKESLELHSYVVLSSRLGVKEMGSHNVEPEETGV